VFQLSLEHAAEAAEHRWVVFVDAAAEGPEPYEVRELGPGKQGPGEELRDVAGFSTHVMGPEAVLALAQASFGRRPPAWLLAVRGYRFGLGDRLSRRAEANLRAALGWLEGAVSALGRGEQA
jgi:hydrogenase maturation protease